MKSRKVETLRKEMLDWQPVVCVLFFIVDGSG